MSKTLLSLACPAYALGTLAYLAFLVRQSPKVALAGRSLVWLGAVAHAASLGLELMGQGYSPVGLAQGLSLLGFLLAAILLALELLYRRPVIGAFLTPLVVALTLAALLLGLDTAPLRQAVGRWPLLPLHIAVALGGLASFAGAAGVGLMYLLMERQMKGKRFGVLFARLPPLQFLDELNRRLMVGGFIALSITLVTGALFSAPGRGFPWSWGPKEIATVVAWALFGALLNARLFAGWQGRRVALLTLAGFGVLMVSFFSAYVPGGLR